jgi:hypothetical protein
MTDPARIYIPADLVPAGMLNASLMLAEQVNIK